MSFKSPSEANPSIPRPLVLGRRSDNQHRPLRPSPLSASGKTSPTSPSNIKPELDMEIDKIVSDPDEDDDADGSSSSSSKSSLKSSLGKDSTKTPAKNVYPSSGQESESDSSKERAGFVEAVPFPMELMGDEDLKHNHEMIGQMEAKAYANWEELEGMHKR